LYRRLLELDPETAGMLHPNDIRRIVRALEVYIKTDKPISELKKKANGLGPGYDLKLFCLNRNRHDLYSRIEARVDKMFKQGFVRECRRLKANRFSLTASQALGYKEVFACLDGEVSSKEARELIKRNTRRFAKRQLSWFRGDKRIVWVDIDKKKPKEAAEAVYALCMK
ncbi:MAG: tRNA (adenosine(37)-N6)-dimethylallyltransferase MiaA, partial [Candidatus Omnitrophica bacterium]|nr:tRNA (adenosine(37)-N6)-dimethylallyltransferase MiaA [Candidatus Omnitrophota bacterium]